MNIESNNNEAQCIFGFVRCMKVWKWKCLDDSEGQYAGGAWDCFRGKLIDSIDKDIIYKEIDFNRNTVIVQ